MLESWQQKKGLTFITGVAQDFEDLSIDRVLPQSTHHIPTLIVHDLPISCSVKQEEGLLKLC